MSGYTMVGAALVSVVVASSACSRPRDSEGRQTAEAARRAGADAAIGLRLDLRKLLTDHAIWTRSVLISVLGDQPDAQAATDRLLANQDEIGALIGRYYGRSTGDQLTALLKEHVWSAVELVRAAKSGDEAAQNRAVERADRNAARTADLLSQVNPNWARGRVLVLLRERLTNTSEEIDARLSGQWDADAKAFGASHKHLLKLADALAEGIARNYPEKFGG